MKFSFTFVLLFGVIATREDNLLIGEERIVVAINEQNTEVVNQALMSHGTEAVTSAFSNTQQSGNSKVLAQIIYNVMSSNPPGSFIVNQMLDIMEQIKKNQGCEQILQILWEIDSLIESDETSEQLQATVSGSQEILDCLQTPLVDTPAITTIAVDDYGTASAAATVPPQDQCQESTKCIFLQQQTKFLLNQQQVCDGMRVCYYIGYDEKYICERECQK